MSREDYFDELAESAYNHIMEQLGADGMYREPTEEEIYHMLEDMYTMYLYDIAEQKFEEERDEQNGI